MLNIKICPLPSEEASLSSEFRVKKLDITPSLKSLIAVHHSSAEVSELIENTIIDSVIGFDGNNSEEIQNNFSGLLQSVNSGLDLLASKINLQGVSIFIGITYQDQLFFSLLGQEIYWYLSGEQGAIDIFEDMRSADQRFSYDSMGTISEKESLYLSHITLGDLLAGEDFTDLAQIDDLDRRAHLIHSTLKRANIQTSCIAILNHAEYQDGISTPETPHASEVSTRTSSQKIKSNIMLLPSRAQGIKKFFVNQAPENRQKIILGAIIIAALLLYFLVANMISGIQEAFSSKKYQELIAQSEQSISQATKNTLNPDAFRLHIKEAERLISLVKEAGKQELAIKELETKISTLEKQTNQINTIEENNIQIQYSLPEDFNLLHVFEFENQQFYVGKKSIIGPFVFGADPQVYPYPDNQSGVFADISDEGVIYVYTEESTIIGFEKGVYSSTTVDQTWGWEAAKDMKAYNGNIYILSEEGEQLLRHAGSASGFAQGTPMLTEDVELKGKISDFDIDGGVYVWKDNLVLEKLITSPYEFRGISINGLGTNDFSRTTDLPQKIIANETSSHIYMLIDGRVWVFQPNTKRYTDVKSVKYVGQIELPSILLRDIWVAKDTDTVQILGATENGEIVKFSFTIEDGKVITF